MAAVPTQFTEGSGAPSMHAVLARLHCQRVSRAITRGRPKDVLTVTGGDTLLAEAAL